ncbi:MAG: hypothetical protein KF825_13610 [Ferruginibacter sp.]|nr:hypothetical protein [Ferruginibacter sp.]
MKTLLPVFLFITVPTMSQQADFIILKKHDKTVATYYSGMHISFTSTSGAYLSDAYINGIKNDTLYLQQFIIQYLPTNIGTFIIDTVGSYHYKYHYNQVAAIGRKERTNFNLKGSGASLMGGGALLALGSGIVFLADKEKFSTPLLLASVGLGTLGYFMVKGKKTGMVIGKKYKLQYMNMSNQKNK